MIDGLYYVLIICTGGLITLVWRREPDEGETGMGATLTFVSRVLVAVLIVAALLGAFLVGLGWLVWHFAVK